MLKDVPKKLVVIGAGVIGLELGSCYRRLGAEVVVIEYLDRVLPGMDAEVVEAIPAHPGEAGLRVPPRPEGDGRRQGTGRRRVRFEPAAGGEAASLEADVVLMAVGRKPYTEGLGLEAAGVATERGRVVIDDHFATNVPGIYAIGDVVRGLMLAHKAEDEGVAVAEIIAGQAGHVNYK